MFTESPETYRMLHPNEHQIICADQSNPFLNDKPYIPEQVMEAVVRVFALEGRKTEALAHYTAAVTVLSGMGKAVTEPNIIQCREQIAAKAAPKPPAPAPVATKQPVAATAMPYTGKIPVKRNHVVCLLLFLAALVTIKVIVGFFKKD